MENNINRALSMIGAEIFTISNHKPEILSEYKDPGPIKYTISIKNHGDNESHVSVFVSLVSKFSPGSLFIKVSVTTIFRITGDRIALVDPYHVNNREYLEYLSHLVSLAIANAQMSYLYENASNNRFTSVAYFPVPIPRQIANAITTTNKINFN